MIGVRGRMPVTKNLTLGGLIDVGGFGVGSEFTWEIFAGLDCAINERFSASLGFRCMSIDYDASNTKVQMDMDGPVAGLTARL